MSESEKKFNDALSHLEKAVKSLMSSSQPSEKAAHDIEVLRRELETAKNLNSDLADKIQNLEASARPASEGNPGIDIDGLIAERDTIKEELELVRKDYLSLEDAMRTLKSQVAEQEELDNDFAGMMPSLTEPQIKTLKAERDSLQEELDKIKEEYIAQLAENELLVAEANGVSKTKEAMKASLDRAIETIETMARA